MSQPFGNTVVFITGPFLGNNCWDEWRTYFESKGYKTMAPSWPHKEFPAEELRHRHPDAAIASNRLVGVTEYFSAIINGLPGKPILIGHSIGGLIVQLLLQRGLAAAGVAIHSFPPRGLHIYKFSFIRGWWEAMCFFCRPRTTYLLSFKRWEQVISNGLTAEQQKESYYAYAIPASKRVIRDAFGRGATITFSNPHAPLLLTSGGQDQLIPASQVYKNYKKYSTSGSIVEYKDFEGQNHLVFAGPLWREEAVFAFFWLQSVKYL